MSVQVALAASDMVVYGEQGGLHIKLKSMPDVLCLPYQHTFRRRDNATDWSRLPALLVVVVFFPRRPPAMLASRERVCAPLAVREPSLRERHPRLGCCSDELAGWLTSPAR